MSGILTFPYQETLALLEISRASKHRQPTMEMLFDGRYRKDGKKRSARHSGFPTESEIDHNKLPPGAILVGDRGVYHPNSAGAVGDPLECRVGRSRYAAEPQNRHFVKF